LVDKKNLDKRRLHISTELPSSGSFRVLTGLPGKIKYYCSALVNRIRTFSVNHHVRANKGQLFHNYLTDPDFELFDYLGHQEGLIVDIGAHRGHCSLAVLSRAPNLAVVAFEPNPALLKPLKFIERRFPGRFKYHAYALGAHHSVEQLLVPTLGRSQLTTNASCRESEFNKTYVLERMESEFDGDISQLTFSTQAVEVRTLDSFDLSPLAIKIDVEGYERAVIEGALETIDRCSPMLVIEMNNQMEFLPLLKSLGYEFYRFDSDLKCLIQISMRETYLNVICLHADWMGIPSEMIHGG
jgi:FkbM family methyltransferase